MSEGGQIEPAAEKAPGADATAAPDPAPEPAPRRIRRRGVGPFSLRQVTIVILVVMTTAVVLTLATVPLGSTSPGLPVPDPSAFLIGSPIPGLGIGDLAPEFEGDGPSGRVQLTDLDGTPIRLADLRGKAVWVNFWASWCPPCQFETPTIRAMDDRYRDRGLVIVAVQVQQTVQAGRDYAERYGLRYRIGADVTGAIFHTYHVFALPTQFFIDPNGVLRQIVNGPLSGTRAAQLIESILPPGSSPIAPRPSTP
ncbi:MAG: TlpA family protein disulfide reductase [Chloroflexi bacterium]|nr:MAG: TlpA family protein disulfide reductase [Chloroflexota bacterium]